MAFPSLLSGSDERVGAWGGLSRRTYPLDPRNAPTPSGMLRVWAESHESVLFIVAGDPSRNGGVGGWQTSEHVLAEGSDWWASLPKVTATWPLLLDESIPGPDVERSLRTLYGWGRPASRGESPQSIRLLGDVLPVDKKLAWKIDDITLGARQWRPDDPEKLRRVVIDLSISSLREADGVEDATVRPTRGKKGKRRQRVIRTQKGDTLRGISVRELGSSGEWDKIKEWNPKKLKKVDPDAPLRGGLALTIK